MPDVGEKSHASAAGNDSDGIKLQKDAFLQQLKSLFESQEKNKFMDCYYKLLDVCRSGLPLVKPGSKLKRMFVDKLDLLFSLLRANRQKQGISEMIFQQMSELSGPYSPEVVIWTVCLAILLQYPRRDLRWSDVELAGLQKSLVRLQSVVLPSLDCRNRTDMINSERCAMHWCHSVLLYVLRSLELFSVTKGLENREEVWEIPTIRLEDEKEELMAAGRILTFLLNKQRCYYRVLVLGNSSAKAPVFSRPLTEILRSFVAAKDDSDLVVLRSQKKRRLVAHSSARTCIFEAEEEEKEEEDGAAKRRRIEDTKVEGRATQDLLAAVGEVTDENQLLALDGQKATEFVTTLNLLHPRVQSLGQKDREAVITRVTFTCRHSSSLLAQAGDSRPILHLALLHLWLFLLRRSRARSDIPHLLLHLTLLLTPDFCPMALPDFVDACSTLSSLILHLLRLHRARILASPAFLLLSVRGAVAEVMRRAHVGLTSQDAAALSGLVLGLSNPLMRLCEAEHRADMSRVVRILVEDYFVRAQLLNLHPEVKRTLLQLIYLLLDVIDPFCLEQMKLDMKVGPRELLKRVLADYRTRGKKERRSL